jgi:hypothetical protein
MLVSCLYMCFRDNQLKKKVVGDSIHSLILGKVLHLFILLTHQGPTFFYQTVKKLSSSIVLWHMNGASLFVLFLPIELWVWYLASLWIKKHNDHIWKNLYSSFTCFFLCAMWRKAVIRFVCVAGLFLHVLTMCTKLWIWIACTQNYMQLGRISPSD